MKKYCINCKKRIDLRSKRCYRCRALYANSFQGKRHSKKTKKIISIKSADKFTPAYKKKIKIKYTGTKTVGSGNYIMVKEYKHPNRNSHNQIAEHILVASQTLGRPLRKGEIVHHIDGNRQKKVA